MPVSTAARLSRREWLLSERPASRMQARLGRAYVTWRRFSANRLAMVGLFIIVALLLVAAFAGQLATHSPIVGDLKNARLLPPSAQYWFGTDDLGRDIYSRIVHGSRLTLFVVVLVAVIAAPIGLVVGTVAGYAGGLVDAVLMRITDIFLAFPKLILALAFVAALGPGIENAVLAIAITSWPPYARIARAETLTVRNSDYIKAVELMGASAFRIVLRHIMPLCLSSLIVRVTLDMAGIILTAAGLGFLGLGAHPPLPEWGAMIASGRRFILDQWWVAGAPGFAFTARMESHQGGQSRFYVSMDKGKSWQGPYRLPDFGQKHGTAARTDYLVNGKHDLTAFITVAKSNGREGRVMAVRTRDGAKTWTMEGWVTPEPEGNDYAIMPSSVRLKNGSIVTAVRYRKYIEIYRSDDDARTWRSLGQAVNTLAGNPPSMIQLRDGRLVLTYGHRAEPYGIRAKVSADEGRTWGEEIILRQDGGTWDLGYPRTVQRPDGRLVTVYYYNTAAQSERFIGYTIWDVK